MTLFELLNTDLKELDKIFDADEDLAFAFSSLFDRIGFNLELGRVTWHEIDHDMNCEHCNEKVTVH